MTDGVLLIGVRLKMKGRIVDGGLDLKFHTYLVECSSAALDVAVNLPRKFH